MANAFGFAYHNPMKVTCLKHFLFLCFAALLITGCTSSSKPSRSDWEAQVQTVLAGQKSKFQTCSKFIKGSRDKNIEVAMTFRLNPSGALETLWLNESASWDTHFYDCLFNVVDGMNFPAFQDDTSLEVEQALVFRPKKGI